MLTYAEALKTMLDHIQKLDVEEKHLAKAQGQGLAEDIYSDYDLPLRNTSGPDGYAVRASDIERANPISPAILQVIETVRAGVLPQKRVMPLTAIRIMTGSVMPEGADCVVRFEDTDEPENKSGPNRDNPSRVKIYVSQGPGTNINPAGGNIRKGSLVASGGTLIGPSQVSSLTAIGKTRLKVVRRPKVAIIATGDELIKGRVSLSDAKSYDCNGPAVQSLVHHYGGISRVIGIARDNQRSITSRMQKGLSADMIITTGGVSKGDYDLVRQVMEELGRLIFSRIKMGPGAAFAFGLATKSAKNGGESAIPVLALSGPPIGCLVNCETLVRPALLKMRGVELLNHLTVEATAEEPVANPRSLDFVKWTNLKTTGDGYTVGFDTDKGSLASIATANSLTILPAQTDIKAGEKIPVWPLDWAQW
jgi:molybdopterin molybdotransferase